MLCTLLLVGLRAPSSPLLRHASPVKRQGRLVQAVLGIVRSEYGGAGQEAHAVGPSARGVEAFHKN